MAVRFRENPEGLAVALASRRMQEAMELALEPAQVYAESISPVRTGRYRTGRITIRDRPGANGRRRRRQSLPVAEGTGGGFHITSGVRNGKAYGRLTNDTPYARFLEFGTRYMSRQRILGRSVHAIRLP